MNLSAKEIAELFSGGQFDKVYPYLADNVVWHIVGENRFAGKKAVIENCEQVAAYFKTVTTNFITENILVADNRVAIEGTAALIKDQQEVSFVWACDVYEFTAEKKLDKITSYCIVKK
jgi:ketosteroid isomerase-like protein